MPPDATIATGLTTMKLRHLLALAATTGLASAAQANLLANGSFESGSYVGGSYGNYQGQQLFAGSTAITNWTVGGTDVAWLQSGANNVASADGAFFLDLTGYCDLGNNGSGYCGGNVAPGVYGSVSQAISTVVGATYHLSVEGGTYGVSPVAPMLVASAGGTSQSFQLPSNTPVTGTWTTYTLDFVATATSTTISFGGTGGSPTGTYYLGVDKASVELVSLPAVPEPGTWALMAAGLLAVGRLARRGQRRSSTGG
jgi:hypothetical protein